MPYLPERYRTRLWFATACAVTGALFAFLFFAVISYLLDPDDVQFRQLAVLPVISLGAFPAALIAWPKQGPRSRKRMALAGILTVFLAFVALSICVSLATAISQMTSGTDTIPMIIGVSFSAALLILFFGTLFTLGLPYLVGALVAMLFADPRNDP